MLTTRFDYRLPPELIAQKPADKRDLSRLMVVNRSTGARHHLVFKDFPQLLKPTDALVINDTRVIPARLYGTKSTGAHIEITLIEKPQNGQNPWKCLIKPGRRIKAGMSVRINDDISVKAVEKLEDGAWTVEIETGSEVMVALEKAGRAPLPPYIERNETDPREPDIQRYQTVYARDAGAVAAPTAGLHFTPETLGEIKNIGVKIAPVTLHVGWGSFAPVRAENAEDHRVEPEYYSISPETARIINETKRSGGRIVAVGTTATRALESAWRDVELKTISGVTDLFILPGFKFNVVDALLTNFHLPKSSLLMLAAAFAGLDVMLDAYNEAVDMKYRFYSYGDAMFIHD